MGTAVAADLNGNGQWDDEDQYGYTSWSRNGCEMYVYAVVGKLSVNKDEADLPFFDLDDLYYYDRFEAISALLSPDGFKVGFGTAGNHGGLDYFIAGQTLFFSESLGNSHSLRNIIFNSLSYPSQVAFNQCDTQVTDLIRGGKTDFASYFAKWSKAIQKEIDKAIRSYEENN